MKQFKQVWHYMLAEPFLWLFYYFVQPSKFHARVETNQVNKRAGMILRLALPIFLISYVFLLLPFGNEILAALLGLVGGIALGIIRNIKWGIAGCFGLGIGLGLGFDVPPQAFAHPSSLPISSIVAGLGIGLAIGLGTYGNFLGNSAKRYLGGVIGGIKGGVWEILSRCLWWAWLGALGGVEGYLMGFVVSVLVVGTPETIVRGITIGAIVGCVLGSVRRGVQKSLSRSRASYLAKTLLFGVVFGIIGGFVGGITWYILGGKHGIITLWMAVWNGTSFTSGSIWGNTYVSTLNGALSIVIGIVVGILLGIADTIRAAGLVVSRIRKKISAGLNIGLRRGLETGVFLGIVGGILVSLASALTNGIAENALVDGLGAGCGLALFYTVVDYRLPVYLVSSFSQSRLYFKKFQDSTMFFTSLDHSSLHWDESVSLPLPFLSEYLVAAFALDTDQALREISFILKERPSQINAVRNCLMEACMRCLEKASISLRDIAKVPDQLAGFLPLGTRVLDPRWQDRFVLMNDAGFDARRYHDWGDWQIKQDALQSMLHHLRSVNLGKRKSGDSLTKEDKLNNRLLDVVTLWERIVTSELRSLEDESPRILDNPYNPGPRLKRGDKLFVGRVDLAKQLMQALGSRGSHPTFSLEGERRMGKSSLLEQLPILLSAVPASLCHFTEPRTTLQRCSLS